MGPRRRRRPGAREAAARLERAVRGLLRALPLPAGERRRKDLDLEATPRRVAETWLEEMLDGYRTGPGEVLADAMAWPGRDLVAVTGIDYHSMCPHHLLPSRGVAHVGYVPGGKVVGFGQIARLVDCFAHRLILEEDLARGVAEALVRELGARGAAVVLDAEQACLSARGERQSRARTHAQCFLGALEEDARLQGRFLDLVGPAPGSADAASPGPGRAGADRPDRSGAGR